MGIPAAQIVSAGFNGSDINAFGIGDAPLGLYFPNEGNTFAVLSTGLAASADALNDSGSLSYELVGLNNNVFQDLAQLALHLAVPPNVTCASIDFALYSEEFPEYVNSTYNDTFTAEIGGTNLIVSGTEVIAPLNFAFGPSGEIIAVNTVFGVIPGTNSTYDGVTPFLRASTRVTPNATVELVFSVQDLGDSFYDSAVFLDNFFWSNDPECGGGVGFTPKSTLIDPLLGGTLIYTDTQGSPTIINVPGGAVLDPTYLQFTPLISPTHPLSGTAGPAELQFAGHYFDLDATPLDFATYLPVILNAAGSSAITVHSDSGNSLSEMTFSSPAGAGFPFLVPVSITIYYSDEDVAHLTDESSLLLYYWDEATGQWLDAATTCFPALPYIRDLAQNRLEAHICHLTEFGMVGR
jgi:hypothetical protein